MKKRMGLLISIASFLILLLLPPIDGLSFEGQRCLALFIFVFFLYLFEVINAAVISLAIVPLLVLLNISDIKEALSGFSSTSTYLIVGSFILATAMTKSKLGDRITYCILLYIGTSIRKITFGIMCVNILMAFAIPSSTARTAMLLPICLKIIEQFQGKKKTKYGANIMMTLCCTNSSISAGILTSTITNPMAVEYIFNATGKMVSFFEWFKWGFPPALIITVFIWILIQIIFKPEKANEDNGVIYIKEQLKSLGAMKAEEKRVAIVTIGTILLWILGDRLGIDSTTTCILGACILCLPKIGYLEWKDCQKNISLNVVFICSGGISLGAAMSSTGTATWMANSIFEIFNLSQYSQVILIILLIVIVQFMHVFFVGTATMANVFFPILLGIATVSKINPLLTILPAAFMIGGYPILMFFNTTPNILCYDTGEVQANDFPKIGFLVSVFACIVYAICVKWYWPYTNMM
ncbi:MAG: citT [Lachnospiraceae bacterium]|jgi:anion transporter|nr:citT [Lachnospiraceae bacterium]